MTIIAGLMCEGRPYLAADSHGLNGSELARDRMPKIWRDGDLLIGVGGLHRLGQTVRYCVTLPPMVDDLTTWLIRSYAPALKAAVTEHGGADKDGDMGGTILIGHVSGLYHIDPAYAVTATALPYEAIGSGASYTLGALHLAHGSVADLQRAVEVATFFDAYCNGPVITVGLDELRATGPLSLGAVASGAREGE